MSGDLQNAISLIKSGHKEEAKSILIQILEEDNQNEKAWIWMSAVVDTDEMRLECLEEVLRINPGNQVAQKGAAKLRESLPKPEPVVVFVEPEPVVVTEESVVTFNEPIVEEPVIDFGVTSGSTGTTVVFGDTTSSFGSNTTSVFS